jgi:hypothetical protein
MAGFSWTTCIEAVIAITETAIDNGADGIDIYFLNSDYIFKTKEEIRSITVGL